jgi:hypothetical protein
VAWEKIHLSWPQGPGGVKRKTASLQGEREASTSSGCEDLKSLKGHTLSRRKAEFGENKNKILFLISGMIFPAFNHSFSGGAA